MTGASDRAGKCPQCGKVRAPLFRPFCSRRCADLDLGQWLKGGYAIPAETPENTPGDKDPDKGS